jgi:hypothetical protein
MTQDRTKDFFYYYSDYTMQTTEQNDGLQPIYDLMEPNNEL